MVAEKVRTPDSKAAIRFSCMVAPSVERPVEPRRGWPLDGRVRHLALELDDGEFWRAFASAGVLLDDRVTAVLSRVTDGPAEKIKIGVELGFDFEIARHGKSSRRPRSAPSTGADSPE